MLEKESSSQIMSLRRDNEYISLEFNKFCDEEGIHKEKKWFLYTATKWCTVMEMARSLLKDKERPMPSKFVAEVVYTSVYLQN